MLLSQFCGKIDSQWQPKSTAKKIKKPNRNETTTTAADTRPKTLSTHSTHQADWLEYPHGHVFIHH